jgi:hypothetical protein
VAAAAPAVSAPAEAPAVSAAAEAAAAVSAGEAAVLSTEGSRARHALHARGVIGFQSAASGGHFGLPEGGTAVRRFA